jgi:hypothetical protein
MIGWFQYEVFPGGITNQQRAIFRGFMIARYLQQQLRSHGVIATLTPRLHRQSPTPMATFFLNGNNRLEDFRPFRHFFDPSSIYCPHDMGPIIDRPRMVLISSLRSRPNLFCVDLCHET